MGYAVHARFDIHFCQYRSVFRQGDCPGRSLRKFGTRQSAKGTDAEVLSFPAIVEFDTPSIKKPESGVSDDFFHGRRNIEHIFHYAGIDVDVSYNAAGSGVIHQGARAANSQEGA